MKKNSILFMIFVFLLVTTFAPIQVYAEANGITVLIDGETIDFDVYPQIINGRTMVPMRRIFEYLGADVIWSDYNTSISANCGYMDIWMQIDNNEMQIDDKSISLDVSPVIDNGRTLVPLRAVAEAFSANVEWIDETQTVKITTKYPKNEYIPIDEFDNKHVRTSYGDYGYFDFEINDNMLNISGFTKDEMIKVIQITVDCCDGDCQCDDGRCFDWCDIKNKEFKISMDLSQLNIPIEAPITLSIGNSKKKNGIRTFSSYSEILYIERQDNEYCFKKPLVWDNNKDFMSKWINPIGYIKTNIESEIIDLSNEICKNEKDDYDKILKIHDWVADNIYYNYDYYYGETEDISYDAIEVYQTKRTVCAGYANLTQALIHAQNIPCRKISGYALGLSSVNKHWTSETATIDNSNHAWVQAYANNRWINIDTTWNSGNTYENGEFMYKGIRSHYYFDISDILFSSSHKYIKQK